MLSITKEVRKSGTGNRNMNTINTEIYKAENKKKSNAQGKGKINIINTEK